MGSKLIKIISIVGIIAAVLTGLVFLITPSLLYLRTVLLLLSFFAIITVLILNFKGIKAFLFKKGARSTLFSFIIVLLVVSLLVGLNYVAYRYNFRFDFSEGGIYTLSEQSQKVINGIRSEVRVYGFMKEEARAGFEGLMKIYRAGNPLIKYRLVNAGSETGLTKRYDVKTIGTVVVEYEGKKLRIEDRFSETTLTNALLKLQLRMEKKIAFLVGHGERSIHDNDIGGISQLGSALSGQGYKITEINLPTSRAIPGDIELLIITAPKGRFLEEENKIIASFIDRNGSVIYLQDPYRDLRTPSFVAERGIIILNGTIIDPDATQFSGGAEIPLVGRYADHEITKGLKKESLRTLYPVATALKEGVVEGFRLTPLAYTSPKSWLESEVAEKVKYDEKKDLKGPLIIGLISESKNGKVIVFGDSDFASNQFLLLGANRDFLVNAVRYATDRGEWISVLPKEMRFHQILLSNSEVQLIRFFAGIFIPFSITLCGIGVWWRRRRL